MPVTRCLTNRDYRLSSNHNGDACIAFVCMGNSMIRKAISHWTTDQRGSVAMIFGLTIFVLGGSLALGLDYARALAVRTKLQAAVDAAALAANPNNGDSQSDIDNRVNQNFTYNMQQQKFGAVAVTVVSKPITDGIRVTANADVPTTFGRLLGVNKLQLFVAAEAISAKVAYEIALVLDNTHSMSGSKLADLKTASKSLIDQVVTASTAGSVKFALVPFSNYVNVGVGNRSAAWMSVPVDYTQNGTHCYTTTDWPGCPVTTTSGTCYNDGVPFACTSSTCTTPGPPQQVCSPFSWNHQWNGCAGSRKPGPDLTVAASFGSPIPGVLDVGCPSVLSRLTTDGDLIKTRLDGMIAQGDTYIASGLMWGWRALSANQPFADGAAPNAFPPTRKVLKLMTDGENTKSQDDVTHEGNDGATADAAMAKLCSNIKAENIEVYSIAFAVTNVSAKTALTACATSGLHFFDAADGSALAKAFSQISASLQKLTLSR